MYKTILLVAVIFSLPVEAAFASSLMDEKPPSAATIAIQKKFKASMPEDNQQDKDFAQRGFIATLDEPVIRGKDDRIVYDLTRVDWVQGEPSESVNPGLWRQTKLLKLNGLFKVADNVWQVRGLSASNMTIIKGNVGWIIIDPLMSVEAATKAKELINKHLGVRPVSAIIYSHSHHDHFAGVRAFIGDNNDVPIIAPQHFLEEMTSEWLMIGNATSRRAYYQVGTVLKPGRYAGDGITIDADRGTISLIAPNDHIKKTGETRLLDGVTLEFQVVPNSEAPAEMNFYLPAQKTLYIAEITSCTMHNIQTPRGALVRDALKWSDFITEAITLYGERTNVLATGHCWPRFGNNVVKQHLALQRDNYKYIHDQTVRMINDGLTPNEIAEQLELPEVIANEWSNRGYYGSLSHNIKGVYQRYIGWWDGIPAHLNTHTPKARGKRHVNAMGGASKVIHTAKIAMASGDYRWSAELLNYLVFAEPEHKLAKALLADSYEQMGYQAESSIWRNIYLTGAAELRGRKPVDGTFSSPDLAKATSLKSFLELLATRLDPKEVQNKVLHINLDITDKQQIALITIENGVMVSQLGIHAESSAVELRGSQEMLMGLFLQKATLEQMQALGLQIIGEKNAVLAMQNAIVPPLKNFPIVTP